MPSVLTKNFAAKLARKPASESLSSSGGPATRAASDASGKNTSALGHTKAAAPEPDAAADSPHFPSRRSQREKCGGMMIGA